VRVLAVLAHPRKDSLSGRIFYNTVDHLKTQIINGVNVQVDVLDLYDRKYIQKQEIPFYEPTGSSGSNSSDGWDEQSGLAKYPFYQETKELFMSADRIFIVYPIYWYAVPGILKCWLDLVTNYAWKFDKGPYGIPLHKIKKALVVNSASMSNLFRWFRTGNSGSEMIKESLKFFGIRDYSFYEIGNTGKLTSAKVDAHIQKIIRKTNWLLS